MHVKTDSEVTSLAPSSPTSPRRPIYYVMSPSHADAEKISLGDYTPGGSPNHPHHSRESSASRFSAPLKDNPSAAAAAAASWRKIPSDFHHRLSSADPIKEDDDEEPLDPRPGLRCYVVFFVVGFALLFTLFSFILWGASRSFKPEISVKVLNKEKGNFFFLHPFPFFFLTSLIAINLINYFLFLGRAWCSSSTMYRPELTSPACPPTCCPSIRRSRLSSETSLPFSASTCPPRPSSSATTTSKSHRGR